MKGWLDNFGKADNANESNVSLPEDFNGLAYDTTGRNYSPAWGGQFQQGGTLPGSAGFMYARTIDPAPSNGKYAKKTKASAQNGKEMQFYQEGLDWKPKSMQNGGVERISTSDPRYPELYKNRQVGAYYDGAYTLPDLPEFTVSGKDESLKEAMYQGSNRFLRDALGVLGSSQTVPMELITGKKQQTPSEAWGFDTTNKPWYHPKSISNFAMDAVLDPTNLIGAGIADDLTRGAIKGFRKPFYNNTFEKIIPEKIVFDLMDDSIDPFGEVLKKLKTHQGPTPFARDVRREAYNYQKLTSDPRYLERVRRIDKDFGAELEPLLKQFNDSEIEKIGTYFPFNISTTDKIPYMIDGSEVDVLGISGLNKSGFSKLVMKGDSELRKINPSRDRYIEINELRHLDENIPARGTVHHELKHHWTNALLDSPKYKEALEKLTIPKSSNEFLKRPDYDYYSKGTEIDAHIMTNMRDEMVKRGYLKDHFDELTKDKLNDFILKERDYRGIDEYFSPGREMIFDRSKFVNFFNKYGLPSTVIGGIAGSQALDQKRNGGIVKDNQGYWNPDNWGKPVEIDSNDITMQGVYQPLLGISDMGDVQYMTPGNDYKFKGSKVTEFPVAKLGINDLDAQPMKKLNQLLNFTNDPDKTNWLDKYQ